MFHAYLYYPGPLVTWQLCKSEPEPHAGSLVPQQMGEQMHRILEQAREFVVFLCCASTQSFPVLQEKRVKNEVFQRCLCSDASGVWCS